MIVSSSDAIWFGFCLGVGATIGPLGVASEPAVTERRLRCRNVWCSNPGCRERGAPKIAVELNPFSDLPWYTQLLIAYPWKCAWQVPSKSGPWFAIMDGLEVIGHRGPVVRSQLHAAIRDSFDDVWLWWAA